jgi:hypothetical protein
MASTAVTNKALLSCFSSNTVFHMLFRAMLTMFKPVTQCLEMAFMPGSLRCLCRGGQRRTNEAKATAKGESKC